MTAQLIGRDGIKGGPDCEAPARHKSANQTSLQGRLKMVPRTHAPENHGANPTPFGNTGDEFTRGSFKIDWLNFTVPADRRQDAMGLLVPFLGDPEPREFGQYTYHASAKWEDGAIVCWSEGRAEALISLNGDSLDRLPTAFKLGLFDLLFCELGGKVSRLDVAWDDFDRITPMEQLHAAAERSDFTGFLLTDSHRPKKSGVLVGDTREFGVRGKNGSGKFLQCYDKRLESKGVVNSIRWELRLFKEHAAAAGLCLASCKTIEAMERMIAEWIAGSIDFIDRSRGDKNIARCPRLAWWQQIRDVLEGVAKLRVDRVVPRLQKTFEWIKRSVITTLAEVKLVVESQGLDFHRMFKGLIDGKESNINWRRSGSRPADFSVCEAFGDWLPKIAM